MRKKPSGILVCICVVVIAVACVIRFVLTNNQNNVTILTSSTLTKVIDIAELSSAEFRYRGIADAYTDDSRTNILCRVCYDAIVKAGIDMEKVDFDIDHENKIVTAKLPDITLTVNINEDNPMITLPSTANINIDMMRKYSKEDAEKEALESTELITVAEDNLKSTIQGLLDPVLKAQEYDLQWN